MGKYVQTDHTWLKPATGAQNDMIDLTGAQNDMIFAYAFVGGSWGKWEFFCLLKAGVIQIAP